MARQQAARRLAADVRATQTPTPETGDRSTLILFDPDLAVRAIAFHLADEGLCCRVAADSMRSTVARLRRAGINPQVEQLVWAEMTNSQRLEWLLQSTRTAARLIADDELSVLEPADA
jgi:hypothetical protein